MGPLCRMGSPPRQWKENSRRSGIWGACAGRETASRVLARRRCTARPVGLGSVMLTLKMRSGIRACSQFKRQHGVAHEQHLGWSILCAAVFLCGADHRLLHFGFSEPRCCVGSLPKPATALLFISPEKSSFRKLAPHSENPVYQALGESGAARSEPLLVPCATSTSSRRPDIRRPARSVGHARPRTAFPTRARRVQSPQRSPSRRSRSSRSGPHLFVGSRQ
jgi:hypothetical protein